MFTKGQQVHYITIWNRSECTFAVRRAVVHSCGKKQMVLADAATGKVMGRHFNPNGVDSSTSRGMVLQGTFVNLTDEEAMAKAQELAEQFKANEIAGREHQLGLPTLSDSFKAGLVEEIENLKAVAPVAVEYHSR